ncbi:hypothetical protein RN001_011433 [Aquatica leii]|uniref:Uncharacterized protein n=1 Tax=Aquatica leii TaxID=1421715 RepID=A0AAN7S7F4_9COLE|nr:hypothetical protein RN001_011433 [Aquatica leii]
MKSICVLLLFVGAVYCNTNLVDFNHIPDLSAIPGADYDAIEGLVKDKCKKNGGNNAFKNLQDSVIELKNYVEKNFESNVITKEIEDASKTGSLDEVFKKYCDLKPEVMKHAHKLGGSIESCLEDDEKVIFKIAENITEGLIDFACDKDGERIALFIVEDGFTCIASKSEALQKCGADVATPKMPTTFDKIPTLAVTKQECDDYKKVQECVLNVLETCSNSTPSNVVDSLLTYIYKLSPCSTLK